MAQGRGPSITQQTGIFGRPGYYRVIVTLAVAALSLDAIRTK
jgi:hypothetical protein